MNINKMTSENLSKFFLSLQLLVIQMFGHIVILNTGNKRASAWQIHTKCMYDT